MAAKRVTGQKPYTRPKPAPIYSGKANATKGDVKRSKNAVDFGTHNVDRGTGARALHPARDEDEHRVYKKKNAATEKDWAESGLRVRVHSSNVAAIRYDKPNQILYVQFRVKGVITSDGALYRYFGVHPATAKSMYNTISMGRFVWYKLRDRYPYERVS